MSRLMILRVAVEDKRKIERAAIEMAKRF